MTKLLLGLAVSIMAVSPAQANRTGKANKAVEASAKRKTSKDFNAALSRGKRVAQNANTLRLSSNKEDKMIYQLLKENNMLKKANTNGTQAINTEAVVAELMRVIDSAVMKGKFGEYLGKKQKNRVESRIKKHPYFMLAMLKSMAIAKYQPENGQFARKLMADLTLTLSIKTLEPNVQSMGIFGFLAAYKGATMEQILNEYQNPQRISKIISQRIDNVVNKKMDTKKAMESALKRNGIKAEDINRCKAG